MLIKSPAVTCIAALLFVGCGVAQEEVGSEDIGTQEQPIIWTCNSTDKWVRSWYTNFNRTTLTGRDYCCLGEYRSEGSWGNYYVQEYQSVCGPIEVE